MLLLISECDGDTPLIYDYWWQLPPYNIVWKLAGHWPHFQHIQQELFDLFMVCGDLKIAIKGH
jgi:hypothetical protein